MNFHALGISITSQRDAGSLVEYSFSFPAKREAVALQALLEAMRFGEEISIADPTNLDCSFEVRFGIEAFEVKRGCHGAAGTWRLASISEAHDWLLPAAMGIEKICRPGYGAVLLAYKDTVHG